MAEVEIPIRVQCDNCNSDIDGNWLRGVLYIEPCDKCRDEAKGEGYQEGYDQAEQDNG